MFFQLLLLNVLMFYKDFQCLLFKTFVLLKLQLFRYIYCKYVLNWP